MGVFKKLLKLKPKILEQAPEKKDECWYNNAHEKGEAVHGSVPFGGSSNSFENGETQMNARR